MSAKNAAVHVLGAGAMGSLVAHELVSTYPEIQVTLLLRNKKRLRDFLQRNREITMVRQQDENEVISKSQVMAKTANSTHLHIDNLVISTKTYGVRAALEPYVANLTAKSNILFLQNGMGVTDQVCKQFWSDVHERPRLFQAISTHGAYKSLMNQVHHVGLGSISIAKLPGGSSSDDEIPDFIKMLTGIPILNAEVIPYEQFILVQIEKLIINACINPTTAIFDCLNGDLLYGSKMTSLFKKIITESVPVLKKEFPILKTIPEAGAFLAKERLLNKVFEVCQLTAKNSSSMREDIKHGNITEIDSINGYITKLAEKHKMGCSANRLLLTMVKDKHSINHSIDQIGTESIINAQL